MEIHVLERVPTAFHKMTRILTITFLLVASAVIASSVSSALLTGGTFTQEVRLSSELSNGFGAYVANSGDTALVTSNEGIYVFVREEGAWTQQTILVPSDGYSGCNVGSGISSPLAFEGDTAVLGCRGKTINGNANRGAAYVFVRSGTMWTEQQRLIASEGAANDEFGGSVAISGSTLIVGAFQDTVSGNSSQGSAHIFIRNGSVWSEQAHLIASDGGAGHRFGQMVTIDGDTAVVGRFRNPSSTPANPAVYVFVRTDTDWQQQQRLEVCEPSKTICRFGYSAAIEDDNLVVGNDLLNVGANAGQGGVYFFTRTNSVWTQQQRITAADGQSFDHFGRSIALEGERLIVGAAGDVSVGQQTPGKAYVYTSSAGFWSFQQRLMAGLNPNLFGRSVSLDGDSLIIAASQDKGSIGAAYVYSESGPTPTPTPTARRSPA